MDKPLWNELPAKYNPTGRTGIRGVVLHDTAGTGTHNDTLYLANPSDGREVSVDFTAERDGSLWKLNADLDSRYCHHAGRSTKFHDLVNSEVNRFMIGIEMCQREKLDLQPLYPDAQIKAVAHLCAWLSRQYNFGADYITTHHAIITDSSRTDPRQFPFDGPNGFWDYFHRYLNNQSVC